jgi:hypothetical protein
LKAIAIVLAAIIQNRMPINVLKEGNPLAATIMELKAKGRAKRV